MNVLRTYMSLDGLNTDGVVGFPRYATCVYT